MNGGKNMNLKRNNLMPFPDNSDMAKYTNNDAKFIVEKTDKLIQQGLERPTASTGTPTAKLSGGALFLTQLSNIGGGSIATGGNGIRGGFNIIAANIAGKSILNSLPNDETITFIDSNETDKTNEMDETE